jgi:hypothetical protein
MGMLSRVVRFGLLWVAALLTPIAGTPHVDCLCPDGHIKLFCLNFSLRPTACCCSGSCCSAGGGGCSCCAANAPVHQVHGKVKACCAHAREEGSTPAGDRLGGTPCKKTLAEADAQTLPRVTAAGHHHTTALTPAAAAVPVLAPGPSASSCLLSWQSYRLPPPTDRVIAFQHLVI